MQALRHRQGGAAGARRTGGARLIRALLLVLAAPFAAAQPDEASLTVYTSNAAPTIQALAADFEKRTGVHVDVWRASSAKVLQRLVAEKKAERWDFDVVSAGGPEMEALYREGLLQEIDSPAQRDLIEGTLPAHRGWAPQFINLFVQAYNSNLLRKQDLPKTWRDLAEPRWKGKLGAEAHAAEWYCKLVGALSDGRGILHAIAARNGLSVREGNSVLANLVVSGEVPLALAVYSHLIDAARERGAPVDWFALAPTIARANGVGVSRRAPHPQAARLFYEYSLTEGQWLLVKFHYISPLKKLSSRFEGGKLLFVDLGAESAQVARCDAAYSDLITKAGRR